MTTHILLCPNWTPLSPHSTPRPHQIFSWWGYADQWLNGPCARPPGTLPASLGRVPWSNLLSRCNFGVGRSPDQFIRTCGTLAYSSGETPHARAPTKFVLLSLLRTSWSSGGSARWLFRPLGRLYASRTASSGGKGNKARSSPSGFWVCIFWCNFDQNISKFLLRALCEEWTSRSSSYFRQRCYRPCPSCPWRGLIPQSRWAYPAFVPSFWSQQCRFN